MRESSSVGGATARRDRVRLARADDARCSGDREVNCRSIETSDARQRARHLTAFRILRRGGLHTRGSLHAKLSKH